MVRTSRGTANSPVQRQGRADQLAASVPGSLFERTSKLVSLAGNKNIFKEGEPADYLYKVKSGCIRTYNDLTGRRRRIYGFYFPGDYFGLETDTRHAVSAETVTPSKIYLVEKAAVTLQPLATSLPQISLLQITTMELQRTQSLNLLLFKDANARLVDFLHEIKRRTQSAGEIDLPMPRSDIADYLGLTIETVSRAITRLKNTSTISMLTTRRFVLRGSTLPV